MSSHVMTGAPALRDYQREAVRACEDAAARGQRRALVVLPTGTGKTVAFAALIRRRAGRALVLVHREELADQARHRLEAAGIPAEDIGEVRGALDNVHAPVVLASVQTLARSSRRTRLVAGMSAHGQFSTLVVDEAHHTPARSYAAVLEALEGPDTLTTGWTATPNRKGMSEVFGEPVYVRDLLDMIATGYLCDVRGRRVLLARFDTTGLRRAAGDYQPADLARALREAGAPEVVASAYVEHAEERPALVFTASVDLAHATADALRAKGVEAVSLDGEASSAQRREALDAFRAGSTRVVVSCALLTEGVDLPETACVVIARPTLSPILYAQMIGRGMRLHPGKRDCLVLDLSGSPKRQEVAASRRSAPVSLATLTGLEVDRGASLLETAKRHAGWQARLARLVGRLVCVDFSLLSRNGFQWIPLDGGTPSYVLTAGNAGRVLVMADGRGRFAAHHEDRSGRIETLCVGATLDEAAQAAEGVARQSRALHLSSPGSAWRSEPPTSRQYQMLRYEGMDRKRLEGITRGEASDLIEATRGQRLRDRIARGAVA